jgi:hypothetical protein
VGYVFWIRRRLICSQRRNCPNGDESQRTFQQKIHTKCAHHGSKVTIAHLLNDVDYTMNPPGERVAVAFLLRIHRDFLRRFAVPDEEETWLTRIWDRLSSVDIQTAFFFALATSESTSRCLKSVT